MPPTPHTHVESHTDHCFLVLIPTYFKCFMSGMFFKKSSFLAMLAISQPLCCASMQSNTYVNSGGSTAPCDTLQLTKQIMLFQITSLCIILQLLSTNTSLPILVILKTSYNLQTYPQCLNLQCSRYSRLVKTFKCNAIVLIFDTDNDNNHNGDR